MLTGLNPRRICRTRDYGIIGCDKKRENRGLFKALLICMEIT
jgi:hypothetical protein